MNGNHRNYCITETDQNTEKSPGNLRRLAVTQTPVKDHQEKYFSDEAFQICPDEDLLKKLINKI